ncbi:MAG: hypothetical protein EZS28_037532 [Streblomastix strix]|uniref:Uncharacterized protein n=1 Tax=Streblomastix strix TaxID=222440 RepID=A0A5J4U9Q7_9EUKA|nr:MAG: hypothetical protein EZS28_037532 [Streblomastix strix]
MIETDNTVAAFNISRGAAATALVKLTDRFLQEAERLEIQLTSLQVPGKENQVADSLSHLEISGDYMINPAVLFSNHIIRITMMKQNERYKFFE